MASQAGTRQFPTGDGQSDTHALTISAQKGDVKKNPSLLAGSDYETITAKEIAKLASNPTRKTKDQAPWFIGSDYIAYDARSHDVQRTKGNFYILPVDIDKGNPDLASVKEATHNIVGDQTSYIIYSTSSAKSDDKKWRVLLFLKEAISGEDYKDTQSAFFDLYRSQGLQCDRVCERPGQLIYLPNVPLDKRDSDGKPTWYHFEMNRAGLLWIKPGHVIYEHREQRRKVAKEAAERAARERAERRANRPQSDGESPVDAYNEAHDLQSVMHQYGYKQLGSSKDWRSPLQSSKSFAVRVFDEDTWVSLSGTDMAAGIGSVNDHCCWGDAFDLYTHFEHGGDYTEAVRAYGRIINPPQFVDPYGYDEEPLEDDFGPAVATVGASQESKPVDPIVAAQAAQAEPDDDDDVSFDEACGDVEDADEGAIYGEMPDEEDGIPSDPIVRAVEIGGSGGSRYDFDPTARAEKLLQQWCFVTSSNEFYHIATGNRMGKDAFNLAMLPNVRPIKTKTKDGYSRKRYPAAVTLMDHLNGESVQNVTYRPDKAGDKIFEEDGMIYANSYNDKGIPQAAENWKSDELWEKCEQHIKTLFGDDAHMLIQWMAHNVQFPGRKILWSPVIVGCEGDGKTILGKMLKASMGYRNVKDVGDQEIASYFNAWAQGSCVNVLEEIRVHGTNRHKVMDRLKPLITNDIVPIIEKRKSGVNVVNVTNYLALTNHMDALLLTKGDRRWGVLKTPFRTREQVRAAFDRVYWSALHDGIEARPGVVRAWLLSIDLTEFDRFESPNMTAAKTQMIEAAKSDDFVSIEEAISLGGQGVTENALVTACLSEVIRKQGFKQVMTRRMSSVLKDIGWEKCQKRIKWRHENHRPWVRVGCGIDPQNIDQIRAELDKTQMIDGL